MQHASGFFGCDLDYELLLTCNALISAGAESPIHLSHYDIDAAEDYHYVSDSVTEAQVFEKREINETWWLHAVTIWVWSAVADQIKSELTLRSFNRPYASPTGGRNARTFTFGFTMGPGAIRANACFRISMLSRISSARIIRRIYVSPCSPSGIRNLKRG